MLELDSASDDGGGFMFARMTIGFLMNKALHKLLGFCLKSPPGSKHLPPAVPERSQVQKHFQTSSVCVSTRETEGQCGRAGRCTKDVGEVAVGSLTSSFL